MTDVNCLTSENTTTTTTATATAIATLSTPPKNVLEPPTSPFVLRAPPSAKSKLILQNMEEVLYSVKQKHREKHKRKREEKRRAAKAEAEAQQQQQLMTTAATTTVNNDRHVLREKTAQRENGAAAAIAEGKRKSNANPLKSTTPVRSEHNQPTIIKHFDAKAGEKAEKPKVMATNVFELMMNARNARPLGTNPNGQQSPPDQQATATDCDLLATTPQTKRRKQMLHEWNEKKGAAKRRIADDARGEYIEQRMDQRAKRLKKMLTTQQPEKNVEQQLQTSSAPVKRPRGRPRTRRLSADVAVDAVADGGKVAADDAVELLAKKRDSLLGYFPKVVSPKDAVEQQPETPRRRPRGSRTVLNTPVAVTTSSGRPRRSCATKARYDYDLEPSPTKAAKQPVEEAASDSVEIINLDDSNPAMTPKKLAPLFVRQLPKPCLDPTALRARHEFLHSGVPEKLKQEQQRQRCFEQYYEDNYELFPRIAHVGADSTKPALVAPLKWRAEHEQEDHMETVRKCRPGSITSCTASDFVNSKRKSTRFVFSPLPLLDNKRSIVKSWKSIFERFPTFKCYNQMREKYRHFSAIDAAQDTQPMGESFVVTRRTRRSMEQLQAAVAAAAEEEEAKPPALAPNGELLFTEKYKPLLFEQVLVNLSPVQELRDFLSNWNGAGHRNSQTPTDDDGSIDFGHDSSSMGINCNTMVLLGPCSSGKTNAVFALANDMNFNVLEINAGMRRTGKKLVQELQEATQSHQIRKEAKAGAARTQQLLQKMQQNAAKRPQHAAGDDDVRKSLILIEDADILFENTDAGFTDAIYTLAASSKRPVIIVATDPNCAHLQRLVQQNKINFQSPNALNISRFLAVLALMENCPIELDELISLYLYNNQNLRKTLMELQFFIQSGGDAATARLLPQALKSPNKSPTLALQDDGVHIHQRLFEFYTTAQNVQYFIPFPVDFRLLRLNLSGFLRHSTLLRQQADQPAAARRSGGKSRKSSCSPKKAWLNNATTTNHNHSKSENAAPLQTLATFYEHLSTAALLDAGGLQLEGSGKDRLQSHLAEQLSHSLVERAVNTCLASKDYAYNLFDKTEQRLNLVDQLGSCCLRTSGARYLDFEPAMRAICRSEKQRAGLERRSSRFYHYLRNHTVNNVSNFSTDLFDAACHVLPAEQTETETPAFN
ncbi:uncharacterized protein LOC6557943 [Drosophila grimshawi]|uniref:GH15852 n=1 Tax=Drosophila grimshawi TaxID=7222 RepID=B4J0A0_DROGR|nr:uncharacterized protein LOC6557943 [Drosophila grimshawi]EDV95701.1 GH15852 [Drosophila grimshawi]